MEINIRGEKIEITSAMKEYAEEKFEKLTRYIKDDDITVNALFKLRGPKQKIEVTIPLKTATLRVEEEGQDFYATVDTALDKLERQIRKNKTRLEKAKVVDKIDMSYFDMDEEENEEKIVKRKKIDVKPMDEEEAILQMELLGHDFFFFKNADTNKTAVIYKRKDGAYGIIDEA
jgi:ribosomal subunit interface protein